MANNFTRKANDFTRTIVNYPKIRFKDLGSLSYKNKDTNEFIAIFDLVETD
jgi:hypothetical protein